MGKSNKEFDGVLWEWKGIKTIRDLIPICPKCLYELDIKMLGSKMGIDKDKEGHTIVTLPSFTVGYSCSKCSFSIKTTLDGVKNKSELLKAAMKEFEHRQRLKEKGKNN